MQKRLYDWNKPIANFPVYLTSGKDSIVAGVAEKEPQVPKHMRRSI